MTPTYKKITTASLLAHSITEIYKQDQQLHIFFKQACRFFHPLLRKIQRTHFTFDCCLLYAPITVKWHYQIHL